jgi:UPF0716 family protein affecting phage T7 exclusion
MTSTHEYPRFELNSNLLFSGGVLIAIGALLGFIGMALGSTVLITASRRWVRQLDVPPSVLAREKLAKAKVATSAGVNAWRETAPQQRSHSPH